jgi:WhiB family redox-sensing transcriptional regulator
MWESVVFERPAWQRQAACKGMDTELFFGGRGDNRSHAEAKAVCDTCPVINECAEYGLWEHDGVWGGTSERQRRRLRGWAS